MRGDLATRYTERFMTFPDNSRPSMYTKEYYELARDHNAYERLISEFRAVLDLDIMAQLQYVDVRAYLADDILVKVDKASMINSLETRAPMLDQYLVEYVASLPSTIRTHNGVLKHLLKRVATDLLPAEILTRRKQGFGVPIKHWFRGDLNGFAYELLLSTQAQQRGIFNAEFIRNLLKAHATTTLTNHSRAIWTLLCLELWFRIYMDEPSMHIEQSSPTQIISSR
jgi:asparagine synthase (glutamine-hydrolysing)